MKKNKKYDYIIMGGGMGGVTIASLLSVAGKSVCLIEGNKVLGGYAHTIKKGKYSFCHEVQYIIGCQPGGPVRRFLKKIGISNEIKFNKLDDKMFDLISIGKTKVGIPHGLDDFEKKLISLYKKDQKAIEKYFKVVNNIFESGDVYDKILEKKDVILHPIKHKSIIKYQHYTLHDLFEELDLSQELRAILSGQAGNLSSSPKQVSLILHCVMQASFCKSAHFPKKGMEFFINKIVEKIKQNKNCKIITNCLVKKINSNNDRITSIETDKGVFHADNFISNIDPKQTYKLLNNKQLSAKLHKKMHYKYSDSAFTIYLGLKNIYLKKLGFGKFNIWHHSTFDIDKEFRNQIKNNDFSHPWLFISTPSMLVDEGAVCPSNCHTMEILTFVNYNYFKKKYLKNKKEYEILKKKIYDNIIEIINNNYLPNIKKYIKEKIIHTPVDLENILHSPKGNVYGCSLTPDNYNINRINSKTYFDNMYFIGATSSYPGIMGTIMGGMDLYEKLKKQ